MTYSFLRFGPGLPLCLGVVAPDAPSMVAALRFEPGFGPLRLGPAAGGARDDGVLASFMLAADSSAGVSAGVGSMVICGAGVSDGGDSGLAAGGGAAGASWGNLTRTSGESLRVMLRDLGFAVIFANRRADDAGKHADVVGTVCVALQRACVVFDGRWRLWKKGRWKSWPAQAVGERVVMGGRCWAAGLLGCSALLYSTLLGWAGLGWSQGREGGSARYI